MVDKEAVNREAFAAALPVVFTRYRPTAFTPNDAEGRMLLAERFRELLDSFIESLSACRTNKAFLYSTRGDIYYICRHAQILATRNVRGCPFGSNRTSYGTSCYNCFFNALTSHRGSRPTVRSLLKKAEASRRKIQAHIEKLHEDA